jgi:hypothetical protein
MARQSRGPNGYMRFTLEADPLIVASVDDLAKAAQMSRSDVLRALMYAAIKAHAAGKLTLERAPSVPYGITHENKVRVYQGRLRRIDERGLLADAP